MRYIKKYALFESIKLKDIDLRKIRDIDVYMDTLVYVLQQIERANGFQDFRSWLIFSCYKKILWGSTFSYLKAEAESRTNELESKLSNLQDLNPEGFKFENQVKEYPEMDFLMKSISECLFATGQVSGIYDQAIKNCVASTYKKFIFDVLENVFWPGYLKNIGLLKCLDLFNEEECTSYLIDDSINKALESSLVGYSKMEKDKSALTKKFLSLLEEIGKNKIRTFENVVFPPLMDQVIIDFFSSNDPSTFSKADEIRNANIPLFDKIKGLLPNIETAADLGDLGF